MSHPLAGISSEPPHNSRRERIEKISRRELLQEWGSDYEQGQHVTFIGPTQRGKTYLSHELLSVTISPDMRATLLSGKPPERDKTMNDAAKKLNLRVIHEWPPTMTIRDRNKNGWVLRPYRSNADAKRDVQNKYTLLREQFRKAMLDNYASSKPRITVVDEAHLIQNELGLKNEYEAPLMRGAPDNAVWSLIQRGRYVSYHAYGAPEHIFIFYDPDVSNRDRYSEIGGADPRFIEEQLEGLRTYRIKNGRTISECLYIRRSGPEFFIVGVN